MNMTYEVYVRHIKRLSIAIVDPSSLAVSFLSSGIISSQEEQAITDSATAQSSQARTYHLLTAVGNHLQVHPHKIGTVVLVFYNHHPTKDIAMEMARDGRVPVPHVIAMSMAIQENSSDLRSAINNRQFCELVPLLFGIHVVQREAYELFQRLRGHSSRRNEVVDEVATDIERAIKNNPSKLTEVINSVQNFASLHSVAVRIKSEYRTHMEGDVQGQAFLQDSDQDDFADAVKFEVPTDPVAKKFELLYGKYSKTFCQIKPIIREHVSLEELKEQVLGRFSDLEKDLEVAQNTDHIIQLLQKKKCYFPYMEVLSALVEILAEDIQALSEAVEKIQQYEEKRKEIYKEVLAMEFAKLALKEYNQDSDVKAEFRVHWVKEETTLLDFEEFLSTMFQSDGGCITLRAVQCCSLVFICSVPLFMASAVIRIIREKEQLLLKQKVEYISVGDDVVFKAQVSPDKWELLNDELSKELETDCLAKGDKSPPQGDPDDIVSSTEKIKRMREEIHLLHVEIEAGTDFEEGEAREVKLLRNNVKQLSDQVLSKTQMLESAQKENIFLKKNLEAAEEKVEMYRKISHVQSQEIEQQKKLLETKTLAQSSDTAHVSQPDEEHVPQPFRREVEDDFGEIDTPGTHVASPQIPEPHHARREVVADSEESQLEMDSQDDSTGRDISSPKTPEFHRVRRVVVDDSEDLQIEMDSQDDFAGIQAPDSVMLTDFMKACKGGKIEGVKALLKSGVDVNHKTQDGVTALFLASENGHSDVVELLRSSADVNIQNNNRMTALMVASKNGHTKVVELLLSLKADVNSRTKTSFTALMFASQSGHVDIVGLLLEHHASASISNEAGLTALMLASRNGHFVVVDRLLDHPRLDVCVNAQEEESGLTALMMAVQSRSFGIVYRLLQEPKVDPNIQDVNGLTAVMMAVKCESLDVLIALLNLNVNVDIENGEGLTALMVAAASGNTDATRELLGLKKINVNLKSKKGSTALILASEKGYTKVVSLLLHSKADVNTKDKNGSTALMLSSQHGHSDVVSLLLESGAEANLRNTKGLTALMLASQRGHSNVVLLLKNRADVNIGTKTGVSALMLASENGRADIVDVLLSSGALVDTQDDKGWTALMRACKYGHTESVTCLLKCKANVNVQEASGCTALIIALQEERYHMAHLLLDSGAVNVNIGNRMGSTAVIVASENGNKDVVSRLLDLKANVNALDKSGWTALMKASQENHLDVVTLLIASGAKVDTQADNGSTALIMAVQNNHLDVVDILLRSGSDVNIQDGNGLTALITACQYGHKDIVQPLLMHNARTNIQDKYGYTALMVACVYGYSEIVHVLLDPEWSVDTSIQGKDGRTALTLAVQKESLDIIDMLHSRSEASVQESSETMPLT